MNGLHENGNGLLLAVESLSTNANGELLRLVAFVVLLHVSLKPMSFCQFQILLSHLDDTILSEVLTPLMCQLQVAQMVQVRLNLHLFLDKRVPGSYGQHFVRSHHHIASVFHLPDRRVASTSLCNELRLFSDRLPHVFIEGVHGRITMHLHGDTLLFIHVPLSDDASFSLLNVSRAPRAINVMESKESFLYVQPGPHLLSRPN